MAFSLVARRRLHGLAGAAACAALAIGCSSSSGGYSIAAPGTVVPPNAQAGSPLPDDSVAKATAKLDDLVGEVMRKSQVPGVAVAVVHGGKVVYAKGFGVRDVDHPGLKVDADTVFQVASVSKPISATVAATQISKGLVAWDTPIADAMPGVQLADPWVSSHVTVGDAFAHRTGLPGAAGDKLEDLGYDRNYIFDHLRMHKLNPFRTGYAYANYGLTLGAEAIARKAGQQWADLAADAIYRPLGMDSTSSWYRDYVARANKAILHQKINGKFVPGLTRDPDQQDPAGGVSSSVNDMAKWLTLVLAGGTYDGKQLFTPKELQPAISPQIVSSKPASPDERAGFYGFGFNVNTSLSGRTGFNHSGAFVSGGATNVSFLPSADVAIVTLTNAWPMGVPETINESFMDLVQYGKLEHNWWALYSKAMAGYLTPEGSLAGESAPANSVAAKPLASYTGVYQNGYYGPVTVTEKDGELVVGLGVGKSVLLKHWDGDVFTFTLDTENAPPGSISKASFVGPKLVLEYYDTDGLGTFTR